MWLLRARARYVNKWWAWSTMGFSHRTVSLRAQLQVSLISRNLTVSPTDHHWYGIANMWRYMLHMYSINFHQVGGAWEHRYQLIFFTNFSGIFHSQEVRVQCGSSPLSFFNHDKINVKVGIQTSSITVLALIFHFKATTFASWTLSGARGSCGYVPLSCVLLHAPFVTIL